MHKKLKSFLLECEHTLANTKTFIKAVCKNLIKTHFVTLFKMWQAEKSRNLYLDQKDHLSSKTLGTTAEFYIHKSVENFFELFLIFIR